MVMRCAVGPVRMEDSLYRKIRTREPSERCIRARNNIQPAWLGDGYSISLLLPKTHSYAAPQGPPTWKFEKNGAIQMTSAADHWPRPQAHSAQRAGWKLFVELPYH